MTPTQYQLQRLIKIFKKTLEDKRFSRAERKAVSQVLEENYSLNKSQREFLRGKLFDMAREVTAGFLDHAVINWLETANKLLLDCYDQDSSVYFSPGDQCQRVIIRELIRSLSSVDICVYTISDDLIAAEILKCSEKNIGVRIISDNEKVYDSGSDIKALARAGIKVRVDNSPHYMHHKFAIFDGTTALTGSYNWTRSAAEQNMENVLVTDDKRVVFAYQVEFDRLWNTLIPFEVSQDLPV
jgi:phosphatidylserine/phosphatidylglycerophosphate/cardiolipin synthase-like enzyme